MKSHTYLQVLAMPAEFEGFASLTVLQDVNAASGIAAG